MIDKFLEKVVERLAEEAEMKRKLKKFKKSASPTIPQEIITYAPPIYGHPQYPIPPPYHAKGFKIHKKKAKKAIKKKKGEAVQIPAVRTKKLTTKEKILFYLNLEASNEKDINLIYPVTKEVIDDKEYVFAYAWIHWNEESNSLIYEVIEPRIGERDWEVVRETIHLLENRLDVPFDVLREPERVKKYILDKINLVWKEYQFKIDPKLAPYIKYYILRDTVGYGKIDPLMRDTQIEDISCNGVGIPIFIFHRNPYIGEIQTNIVFNSHEELDAFVMKLALKSGRSLSVARPLLDAALPDGSRIQITYGKDISRKGSSFTIRKFSKDPFTATDLINYGTADENLLAYIWTLVEEGKSILISGGTATGKTSFLNAISLFIKPEKKIVSIEDTAELRLPHPNWLAEVARSGFGPKGYGEVTLVDLLKAALRQRPDYIIVGEVRGEEAYILFQAMATGHPGLGTIHADTFEALIDRLISPPISLPPVLLEVLDAVVFLRRVKYQNKYVRRVDKIYEIVRWNKEKRDVDRIISFRWDPATDTFVNQKSVLLKEIMEFRNWSVDDLYTNLTFKARILEYLWKNKIRYYKDVAHYIEMYYTDPDRLKHLLNFQE
jgi:flagellar protein FlaI